MTYTLQITTDQIPRTPNALGKAGMWYTQNERKKWRKIIDALTLGRRPPSPLKKAKATYIRCTSRQPDYDNMVSANKFVQDALVFNKIIIDDKPGTLEATYSWQKVKPKEGKLIIIVEGLVNDV